jgi:dolichyl-phosphate beta-glucosyltransferase
LESTLSLVVPAYNEESRLPPTLDRIVSYLRDNGPRPVEILVVDDGSKDGTCDIVRSAAARLNDPDIEIRLLENPGNRGKGYSVRHGMLEAEGEWVLFTDADLSAPIEELSKLLDAVRNGGFDGAIGSRALNRELVGVHQSKMREMSGRLFNVAVRLGAGLSFRDTQCGFKLFSRRAAREIFRRQRLERFGFDVEILYLAKKLGFQIVETPVRWNDVEGTKVSLLSGADAFVDIARVRCNDLLGRYR